MLKLFYLFSLLFLIVSKIIIIKSTESSENDWTYDLMEVHATTSNEGLLKFKLKIDRIKRGVFGLTGPLYINTDFANSTVEHFTYYSATSNLEFKLMPFGTKKVDFNTYYTVFYKNYVKNNYANCSDLPDPYNFKPPFVKGTYHLTKCQLPTTGFARSFPEGYYKLVVKGEGEVEWTLEYLVKIEIKS